MSLTLMTTLLPDDRRGPRGAGGRRHAPPVRPVGTGIRTIRSRVLVISAVDWCDWLLCQTASAYCILINSMIWSRKRTEGSPIKAP